MFDKYVLTTFCVCALVAGEKVNAQQSGAVTVLEEIVVSARKRLETVQDVPISISVMDSDDFENMGVNDISDLSAGAIPSVRVSPFPLNPSATVIFMRGVGNSDATQVTKDSGVGIYMDGVYLGRVQGLGAEIVDLERMEVLRGPQGTIFGRNSTGGALNMVSAQPLGEFNLSQKLSVGNYDRLSSVTHIDLPALGFLSSKLSYLTSERDGYVENTTAGQSDYGLEDKEGHRVALYFDFLDELGVDANYVFDSSDIETSMLYYQHHTIFNSPLTGAPVIAGSATVANVPEPDRKSKSRGDANPLKPSITESSGHTLTINWEASDDVSLKSITSRRDLEDSTFANFGSVNGVDTGLGATLAGVIATSDIEQSQFSQEFLATGSAFDEQLDFVAGLYYFKEDVKENGAFGFSLSYVPGLGLLNSGIPVAPSTIVDVEAKSQAIFGQLSWTPPVLDDQLQITLGGRYSEDQKTGVRSLSGGIPSNSKLDVDDSHFDPALTFSYSWNESVSTYVKYASAYRSGGANTRSAEFLGYSQEVIKTLELGLKSDFWQRRARVNVALHRSDYEDKQLDFSNPLSPSLTETINAKNTIDINGLELDVLLLPLEGLTLNLQYAYLDTNVPDQLNVLTGLEEQFVIAFSPKHAGTLSADYRFSETVIGVPSVNISYTYSDDYYYGAKHTAFTDDYSLWNARVSLSEINIGEAGQLTVSAWVNNLADEEYVVHSILTEGFGIANAFGMPRTYGVDIVYDFK